MYREYFVTTCTCMSSAATHRIDTDDL